MTVLKPGKMKPQHKAGQMDLVATPVPEAAMECRDCDNIETDPIFLDTETCSKCGGFLSAVDMDDDN